jgi:hypothetical protein
MPRKSNSTIKVTGLATPKRSKRPSAASVKQMDKELKSFLASDHAKAKRTNTKQPVNTKSFANKHSEIAELAKKVRRSSDSYKTRKVFQLFIIICIFVVAYCIMSLVTAAIEINMLREKGAHTMQVAEYMACKDMTGYNCDQNKVAYGK